MSEPQANLDDKVELVVKVSEKNGVKGYGFAYDGQAVPMSQGKGKFRAPKNQTKRLEWVMIGNPGGTMKVEVLRGTTVIQSRAASQIVPPLGEGLDAFNITVS